MNAVDPEPRVTVKVEILAVSHRTSQLFISQ
jgi:hypothetical protein